MTASKIEWTDRSDWNPIRGCTRVSPGCGGPGNVGGCYAEVMAARFSDPGQWGHGYAERTAKGGRWTGKVEVQWDRLTLPIRWRNPAKIFASSTSDFFHAAIAITDIAQLFGVMIAAHHLRGHTFQVLTKRADLMRSVLTNPEFWEMANASAEAHVFDNVDPLNRCSNDARATLDDYSPENPPPGIWLGVSVEDQQRADERRDDFRDTPAAVKFVSYEPALGSVDWTGWDFVDQIIGGGESGPKARPCHPDWQRVTRDFCAEHGIAYFLKQWGEWGYTEAVANEHGGVDMVPPVSFRNAHRWRRWDGDTCRAARDDESVGEFLEPGFISMPVGKKAAGRLLDGVEHNGMPA